MELNLHTTHLSVTEDNVKKAYISPVTSLLVSLALALGILVSDLSGYRLLTTAHAQQGPCGGGAVSIVDGLMLNGLTVGDVIVNGNVVENAVIAGSVRISNAQVVGSTGAVSANSGGVIVGVDNPVAVNGVIVGVDAPCSTTSGVIVGVDNPVAVNGVIVGVDNPVAVNGVIVGVDGANLIGVTGGTSGTAIGGVLTGDGITVNGGVITGQNLMLSGAVLSGGSIDGMFGSVSLTSGN